MKKSVARRLLPATLLFCATVFLLVLCAAALAVIDKAAVTDSASLATMRAAILRAQAAAEGIAAARAGAVDPGELAATLDSAASELRAAAAETESGGPGAVFYGSGLRRRLEEVRLGGLTTAQDAIAGFRLGGRLHAIEAAFEDLVAEVGSVQAGVEAFRRSSVRILLALFAVFTLFGAASATAYALYAQSRLGKELGLLADYGRSVVGGLPGSLPPLRGSDATGELTGVLGDLGTALACFSGFRETVARLSRDSRVLVDAADEAGASARGQADAASEAGSGLPLVARGVSKVAESAAHGLAAAGESGRSVERLMERIRANVEGTRSLEESSSRIEEVVALIGDVADQTELLSLNAAIEAARAGEAGRGFTVVAQQVRKLADRSARAASEISELVQSILGVVKRIASDSRESLDAVQAFQRDIGSLSRTIMEISELALGASRDADPAARAMERVKMLAAQSARSAQDLGSASRSLRESVSQLERGLGTCADPAPGEAGAGPVLAITPVAEPGSEAIVVEGRDEIAYLPPEPEARAAWTHSAAADAEGIEEANAVEDAIPVEEPAPAGNGFPEPEAIGADREELEELEAVDEE